MRSWQEKWEWQLLVEEIHARDTRTSEYFVFLKICHKFSFAQFLCYLLTFIVMQLHVLPVPRLRLPVSLLTWTRHM